MSTLKGLRCTPVWMSNEDKSNIYQLVQNITSKSNGKIAIEARMSSLDLTCAEEAEEDQNFWATLMVAVGILPGLAKTASPIHFEEVWDSRFLKIAAEGGAYGSKLQDEKKVREYALAALRGFVGESSLSEVSDADLTDFAGSNCLWFDLDPFASDDDKFFALVNWDWLFGCIRPDRRTIVFVKISDED